MKRFRARPQAPPASEPVRGDLERARILIEESREIVHALNAVAANVSFVEIKSDKGHDAFLLHEPELFDTISKSYNMPVRIFHQHFSHKPFFIPGW